jgi:hypothetical protein
MGGVGVVAMRRKPIPLLTVFALLLVAAGGATAAGDAGTNITDESSDATSGEGGDVGICVVGADSPCNDAPEDSANATDANESSEGERTGDDADDGQMWIPEDQNRDGEIDDRFVGDENASAGDEQRADEEAGSDDAGICLVGADSPCNDSTNGTDAGNGTDATHPTPSDGTDATHPTPSDGTEIGSGSGQNDGSRIWIPEDQNRDGEIDDRFAGGIGQLADLLFPFVSAF